jgi:hypothetical protein
MSCATSSQCPAVIERREVNCENSRRISATTSPRDRRSRAAPAPSPSPVTVRLVDEAFGIWVLRVHRRIEAVVGDDPFLHRDEQLLAILIGA